MCNICPVCLAFIFYCICERDCVYLQCGGYLILCVCVKEGECSTGFNFPVLIDVSYLPLMLCVFVCALS